LLLCGFESWRLMAEVITRLRNWHNKRIREMCRVAMCQTLVHQITLASFQKRTGAAPSSGPATLRSSPKAARLKSSCCRGKPQERPPRCGTWVSPEDMRWLMAQRGRHIEALSPAPQQQHNHDLFHLGEMPSDPALSHPRSFFTRRYTKTPRGSPTQRKPT
jgi:hypothetical protein